MCMSCWIATGISRQGTVRTELSKLKLVSSRALDPETSPLMTAPCASARLLLRESAAATTSSVTSTPLMLGSLRQTAASRLCW